jgi:hypothetical protein
LQQIQSSEQKSGIRFLVCGVTFDDFVQQQNNDYIAEKENEKALRVILFVFSSLSLLSNLNVNQVSHGKNRTHSN